MMIIIQGPAQRLVSGGRSWHQNVNFYTTAMFLYLKYLVIMELCIDIIKHGI